MPNEHIVVLITVPSAEVGRQVADRLVGERLAACVNILPPMQSIYRWKGEVQVDEEVLLLCKTTREGFRERFIPAVQSIHPYEVPEIIALPILMGAQNYLDWIDEETG